MMKKTFSKLLATAAAVTMIASAVPAAMVNADDTTGVFHGFAYRLDGENAIITGFTNEGDGEVPDPEELTRIAIPEAVTVGDKDYTVVGVDDLAFAELANLVSVECPDTLQLEYMGNVAFLTTTSIYNYLESQLGEDALSGEDPDLLVDYAMEKIAFEGTVEQFVIKLGEQFDIAGVEEDDYIGDAVVKLYRNIDNLTISEKTRDKIEVWMSSVAYYGFEIIASEDSDAAKYALGREVLGMNFVPSSQAVLGDANLDGVLNVRDAAFIANYLANGKGSELPA
ncbi:MAG: hypothetical protein ACI4JB_07515, partial [Porcipelethomonas sp.]